VSSRTSIASSGFIRYAEILLDMAHAVSERGGRLSWLGVGIDGCGLLSRRIDRILSAGPPHDMSFVRKAFIVARRSGGVCTGEGPVAHAGESN
jgi:hypothetical protein